MNANYIYQNDYLNMLHGLTDCQASLLDTVRNAHAKYRGNSQRSCYRQFTVQRIRKSVRFISGTDKARLIMDIGPYGGLNLLPMSLRHDKVQGKAALPAFLSMLSPPPPPRTANVVQTNTPPPPPRANTPAPTATTKRGYRPYGNHRTSHNDSGCNRSNWLPLHAG